MNPKFVGPHLEFRLLLDDIECMGSNVEVKAFSGEFPLSKGRLFMK